MTTTEPLTRRHEDHLRAARTSLRVLVDENAFRPNPLMSKALQQARLIVETAGILVRLDPTPEP